MESKKVEIKVIMTNKEFESFEIKCKKSGFNTDLKAYTEKILTTKHHIKADLFSPENIISKDFTFIISSDYYSILKARARRIRLDNDFQAFLRKIFFTPYFVSKRLRNDDKQKRIGVRMTEKERMHFEIKSQELGMSMSDYFRSLIFKKDLVLANPDKLIKELYSTRGEINKIGSNINQLANYANFLTNQDYVEIQPLKEFKKEALEIKTKLDNLKKTIDKTIKRI